MVFPQCLKEAVFVCTIISAYGREVCRSRASSFAPAKAAPFEIRKLLRSGKDQRRVSATSGSMDDAVALAILIEQVARYGQTLAVAEAMDLAERLEPLFDQLRAEVDSLLAS